MRHCLDNAPVWTMASSYRNPPLARGTDLLEAPTDHKSFHNSRIVTPIKGPCRIVKSR